MVEKQSKDGKTTSLPDKAVSASASTRKYILLTILAWSTAIVLSLAWNLLEIRRDLLTQAQGEARSAFNKDLQYRRWAASHGGIYVPVTDDTPPNPYLSDIKERDIETPSGRSLTLVNPAYMVRQVFELYNEQNGLRSHITSLNPIRMENAPDHWERKALKAFEQSETEVISTEEIDGKPFVRLMRPMVTESRCLKCHAEQGYKEGEIRGGISVSVPLEPYRAAMIPHAMPVVVGHILFWLLGTGGLGLGGRSILQRERARARAEEALRQSEMRYREVVEGTADLITTVDREGRFTYVNYVAKKVYGLNSEQCIGLPAFDFIHPDDQERTKEWFRKCVGAGMKQASIENQQVNRETGAIADMLWTCRFHYDDDGQPKMVSGIARDITERKRAEEVLRQSEARWRLSIANMLEGYALHEVIFDENGRMVDFRYIEFNPAAQKIVDIAQEDIIGKTARALFPNIIERGLMARYAEVVATGESAYIEDFYYSGDTLDKAFDISCFRIDERHFGCVFRDITERKRAEEEREKLEAQLRQSQKMEAVGQLAGGVAHDFNNLLQAILGYGDQALDRAGPDSPLRASVQEILNASHRASTLVRQLLAFSRRQVLEMEDVDLNDLIANLMKMIRRVIGEHIELDVVSVPDLGNVRADPGQIEQIIINLCVNARDAMPEGGKITIETGNVRIDEKFCETHPWSEPGKYALLSVTDTGCGMNDETIANAFEPFFTTKGVGEGTGLGLSTVYGLVKQHDGLIHVYSEAGKGTTFKIYLPFVERSSSEIQREIEKPVVGGTETILLAEDDKSVRKLTESILEQAGYTVHAASDGAEALAMFKKHGQQFDLALLDVVMPNRSGREVHDRIKAVRPDLPVLFSSGYSESTIHTRFILEEGMNLISKPSKKRDLLRKVREVLDAEH